MIAKRIIALMGDKNLTSKQFAEELNISPSIVTHITSGRNNPSLDIVVKIKNRFPDISLDWLVFGTSSSPTYDSTNNSVQNSLESDIKQEPIKKSDPKDTAQAVDLFSLPIAVKSIKNEDIKAIKLTKVILFYSNGKFEVFEQ